MEPDAQFQAELNRLLPAHLQQRLSDRDGLRKILTHLSGLQRAVTAFIPLYIAEDEDLIARDYSALRPGSFLFADVSGFTALSERLQQHSGAEGAETLTAVINDYFATMLEILAKSDGQLLKFAGDALLAFFPASENADDLSDAQKAIRTGLRMQRAMQDHFQPVKHETLAALLEEDHGVQLVMSIGIARGRLMEALVGNKTQRDHVIMGELPGRAMAAEAAGDQGEVIIDGQLAALLGEQFRTVELAGGFRQVVDDFGDRLDDYEFELVRRRRAKSSALFDLEPVSLLEQVQAQVARVQPVARFLPPAVLHELVNSEDFHVSSENRYAVTMFIHVTGFAELLHEWGDEHLPLVMRLLGRYYNIIWRIVYAHGGTLARTDPYKLGMKLLITFGAPVAHPDDPNRAVAAALEMMRQVRDFNHALNEELPAMLRRDTPYVVQRIGITQGYTFAGEVGWKARREFTVMGDDVNLAARLMAKAEAGQILIASRVYKRVGQAFETISIEPLILKGKNKPVHAYIVTSETKPQLKLDYATDLPFIGHDMFMLSLGMALKQAMGRRRRAIGLVGEAGIGKTRIAQQVAQNAQAAGFRVAWATCQARNDRKTTWAALIAQLLDINPAKRDAEERRKLHDALQALEVIHLEPVLSDLLFEIAPIEETAKRESPSAAPADKQRIADLFAMFSQMSEQERKTSGMFGVVRRAAEARAQAQQPSAEGEGLWKKAEQRTSLEEGITRFIRAYCERTPTLLVIDDVHQENAAALETHKHVLSAVTQGQLVLLFTWEPSPHVVLDVQTLTVPDLSREETELIALALLRANDLGDNLARLLWSRSSGRPLFIESLLRMLLEDELIVIENGWAELRADANVDVLPENVRELVISRIDRLSADAQHLVRAAAVLEEDFTLDALVAVSDFQDEDRLRAALDELMRVQIIKQDERGLYNFRHGMTQGVIYETISRAVRVKMHRAAAAYLSAHPITGAQQVITLAHHTVKCGLLPRAMELVTQAAADAEAKGDLDGAIELYSHALSIFPDEHSLYTELERLLEEKQKQILPMD